MSLDKDKNTVSGYQLTNQQQQIINIENVFTNSSINTLGVTLEFAQHYDYDLLNKACNNMIAVHDSFQIRYKMNNDNIVQVFGEYEFVNLSFYDFSQNSEDYDKYLSSKMNKCYFGIESKLYDMDLFVHPNGNLGFALFMHHSISDAWSLSEIASSTLCKSLKGEDIIIHSFEDFLKEELEGKNVVNSRTLRNKQYWEDKLDKYEGTSEYSKLKPDTNLASNRYPYILSDNLTNQLKQASIKSGVSLPALILAACTLVKSYHTYSDDVCIGLSLLGRGKSVQKKIMGNFAKAMPLLLSIDKNMKITEFINLIKKEEYSLFKHQDYNYSDIKNYMNSVLKKDFNLLEFCFSYQNAKLNSDLTGICNNITWENSTNQNIPLTLHVSDRESRGTIQFDYDYMVELVSEEYIQFFNSRLVHVIFQIADAILVDDKNISEINIIPDTEISQILNEFNINKNLDIMKKSVVEVFEEQVNKNPDGVALVYEGRQITYRQLNNKANRLAHKLRKIGVQQEDRIAILVERNMETIIGIYGILKSGGAYVPIDSSYPLSRVEFVLEDCKPKALLVSSENKIGTDIPILDLNSDSSYETLEENPILVNKGNDLAYIIYTSGTTGKPKGVMIEHKDIIALVANSDYTLLNENTVILQTGSIAFDASTFEIWGASLNGGRLCLVNEETLLDAIKLKDIINRQKITTMFITTALFNQMLSQNNTVFNGLRHILFGGEQTSERHVDIIMNSKDSNLKVSNVYGPTENTTFASSYLIPESNRRDKTPIGKPIVNTQMYIMNGDQLCGIGMPGELCIAGVGVSRGYLNRPELTREKFIKNPFGEGLMYRSGDLTRWLQDGSIEYLGRMDAQVKIRGFRIELNEIENVIRRQPNIKDVAVIAKVNEEGEKYLCAYIVWENGNEGVSEEVRHKIRQELPEYMVPAYWTEINQIPLTSNGKLNRDALPNIKVVSSTEYIPPVTDEEIATAYAFSEILGVGRIGVTDSFFELGGDSIKAIRVCSKLRGWGYELNIRDIMAYQSIRMLCEHNCITVSQSICDQSEVSGVVMLAPIQSMFFQHQSQDEGHFNQAVMLESDSKIQRKILENALKELVIHHDMLRSVYIGDKQYIRSVEECGMLYNLYELDLRGINEKEINNTIAEECTYIQNSMDLKNGPLIKCGLFRTVNKDYLMLCIHHLVVDGVSWRIIVEDLNEVYSQCSQDKKINMPLKSMSYLNWVETLYEYSNSSILLQERNFWEKQCYKANLVDTKKQYVQTGEIGYDQITYTFSKEDFKNMLGTFNTIYNAQINDVLLTALCLSVRKWGDRDIVAVELEGHGRENLHVPIDINRTVGWFTCKYPVVFDTYDDVHAMLLEVRAKLLRIPNHGVGFGVLKYISRDENLNANMDICFNYLGEIENLSVIESNMKYSSISCGTSVSTENKPFNTISIDVIMLEEELVVTLTYDKSQIKKTKVDLLGKTFISEMNCMLEFTNSCHMPLEEVVITEEVSDDDFSDEEIDVLNDLLESLEF